MSLLFLTLFACGGPTGPASGLPATIVAATQPATAQEVPTCLQWEVALVRISGTDDVTPWTFEEEGSLGGTRQWNLVLPDGWEPVGGGDGAAIVRRCIAI